MASLSDVAALPVEVAAPPTLCAVVPTAEFSLCIVGKAEVGKSSIVASLLKKPFTRKKAYKPTMDEAPVKSTMFLNTDKGRILINLFDWCWEEKKRELDNINQQLMLGRDGMIFVYDVNEKRSIRDFGDYVQWYERAAGFEKPMLVVSSKNDSKKKVTTDGEGNALARAGHHRSYVATSCEDVSGLDDMVSGLAKLLLHDANVAVSSYGAASEPDIKWASDRSDALHIGMKLSDLHLEKSARVVLVAMNSGVAATFHASFDKSQYVLEHFSSGEEVGWELDPATPVADKSTCTFAVSAIVAPPTATAGQQKALKELGDKYGIPFVVSVPRNAVEACQKAVETYVMV